MKLVRIALSIALTAVFLSSPAISRSQNAQDADVTAILKRMVRAYHSLSTYSDRGTSITYLGTGDSSFEVHIEFATYFKRPKKFMFTWTELPGILKVERHSAIWSDGSACWSSYSFNDNVPERDENLSMAVAGATGVSSATAHEISSLLMDEIGGLRLDMLRDYRILGTEVVDGADCYILSGNYVTGDEQQIWVDKKDYVIRRLAEREKGITKRLETRTDIKLNVEIQDTMFATAPHF